ncbi:solute carrier family 22 member 6-A-like isoform X3 [Zootermopsis nevadensis]|uniref:solute carrier family 22 member 6-A-like isoform X3 n=1 Tax=Zootermopsis nevadensis TaxID=136037 RepID=UPI000B8E78C5|nr:solute carrier family 22 member 6-A-like isoform X3 [Zootermopsis nevadensis]
MSMLKVPSKVRMAVLSEDSGQWKMVFLFLIGCNYAIVGINHTLPTFQGYTPRYFCQVDNVSAVVEGCVKDLNSSLMQTEQSCPQGYQFKSDRDDWTVVTEWQLVCERRFLRPLLATIYFCGVTVGAVVFGILADQYGRRPVVLICLYAQGLVGVCLYFVQSLAAFMALRCIQGFFIQGLQGTTYTLMVELFPQKFRTAVGVVLELYWAVGLIYLAGASYYVPGWRSLELILSIPTAVTLLYVCFVPESARWLALHGRAEAQKTWKRIILFKKSDKSNDTNSIKSKSNEFKCTGCDIGFQNKVTSRQYIVNNVMIQTGSGNADSGYADTDIQLRSDRGEDCEGLMKQDMVEDKLKGKAEDYARWQDVFSVDAEHLAIMQDPINSVGNRSSYYTCKQGNGDCDKSQDTCYLKASDCSATEVSHLLSCKITNDCSETINGAYRTDNNKKLELIEGDEVADVSFMNTFTGNQNSNSSVMKGKQNAQELKDGEGDSIGVQCMSGTASETKLQCEGHQEVCIKKETLAVDDNRMNAVLPRSTCKMILVSGEGYRAVGGTEIERNGIVTDDSETISVTLSKGAVRMNTGGTVVGQDGGVICSDMPKTCNIIENNTATDTPKMTETAAKRTGFFELFRSAVLRKYNLIMVLVWFSDSLLYYGIIFHLPDLNGERHMNFLLGAVVEILSYILAYIILSRFGRRLPLASFLLIGGIICVLVGAVSVVPEKDAYWVGQTQTAMAIIGKGVVVSGFCTMFLYTSELFPTVLRGVAIGHCGFWGRVGSLLAPQLLFLGEYTLPAVPLVIMGILGMLAGLSVLALPETLGRQLPDTVEEVEMWIRNRHQL